MNETIMMKHQRLASQPVKSTGTAVLLTLLFGPLGLFYASAGWGVTFLLLHAVAALVTLGLGNIALWVLGVFVSVEAVSDHNRQIRRSTLILMQYQRKGDPVNLT